VFCFILVGRLAVLRREVRDELRRGFEEMCARSTITRPIVETPPFNDADRK